MRFAFTDDQLALRDAVRELLAAECPAEVVRAAWPPPDADGQGPGAGARGAAGSPAALWRHLADMGVLGVAVPEAAGGLGMGPIDWVLLAEEVGYAAIPAPFAETALVVAPLLAELGDPDGLLAPLVAGDLQIAAELTGAGPVLFGSAADHAVLRVGDTVRVVSRAELGTAGTDAGTVDGALAAMTVDRGVLAAVGTELASISDEGSAAAFDRGALAAAAQLVGLGRRMLEQSVAYVVERRQFGVPIGSFQAVKHHLADARLRLEFAAPAVYRAAWSVASGAPTATRDVSMAKSLASDAAHLVGRKALQVHGGIGYTVEYDLHLFLKRAWVLEREWGTAAWHRDRLGRSLGV